MKYSLDDLKAIVADRGNTAKIRMQCIEVAYHMGRGEMHAEVIARMQEGLPTQAKAPTAAP